MYDPKAKGLPNEIIQELHKINPCTVDDYNYTKIDNIEIGTEITNSLDNLSNILINHDKFFLNPPFFNDTNNTNQSKKTVTEWSKKLANTLNGSPNKSGWFIMASPEYSTSPSTLPLHEGRVYYNVLKKYITNIFIIKNVHCQTSTPNGTKIHKLPFPFPLLAIQLDSNANYQKIKIEELKVGNTLPNIYKLYPNLDASICSTSTIRIIRKKPSPSPNYDFISSILPNIETSIQHKYNTLDTEVFDIHFARNHLQHVFTQLQH